MSDTSLNEAIHAAIDARLTDVHTSLPARIEKFDSATRKATVKPTIRRSYMGKLYSLPILSAVPVSYPWGDDSGMVFELSRGTPGMLIFSERSMEIYLARGGDADPGDPRKFDFKDAVFLPGTRPFTMTDSDWDGKGLMIRDGRARVALKDGKVAIGNDTAELLDLLDKQLQALVTTQVLTAVGTYPLSSAATFAEIKTTLASLKGSL